MKVYIASPIFRMNHINQQIHCAIKNELQLDVFLPISIHDNGVLITDMRCIADICYKEIEQREIIVVVEPFGLSVAAEVGYAVARKFDRNRKIIIFYCSESEDFASTEAMLIPFFDYKVNSIQELLEILRNLTTKSEQKDSKKLAVDGTTKD